jgi:hypothetical protein
MERWSKIPFMPQNEDYTADRIITEFKSLVSLEEQLKFVLLHLYSLPADKQQGFRQQILDFEKLLANNKFMRLEAQVMINVSAE